MAGQILTLSLSDGVAVAAPSAFSGINAVASANYTITDTDGYSTIDVTTGGSNRTITLPSAANNTGRRITISKADSGTGQVLISGTVNGFTDCRVGYQYDTLVVMSTGSAWVAPNGFYSSGYYSAAFAFDGGGATATDNMQVERIGNTVQLFLDSGFRATTGTGSVNFQTAVSPLPSWAVPATNLLISGAFLRNNATGDTGNIGYLAVTSAGILTFQRNTAGTAWTNAANGGIQTAFSMSYLVRNS